jgi:hypothetical protein
MADQRELSGVLSRNKKRESDREPEYRRSCMIDGIAYWISAWVKEGDDGKFFSLAFTAKEQPSAKAAAPNAPPRTNYERELDDEIPF